MCPLSMRRRFWACCQAESEKLVWSKREAGRGYQAEEAHVAAGAGGVARIEPCVTDQAGADKGTPIAHVAGVLHTQLELQHRQQAVASGSRIHEATAVLHGFEGGVLALVAIEKRSAGIAVQGQARVPERMHQLARQRGTSSVEIVAGVQASHDRAARGTRIGLPGIIILRQMRVAATQSEDEQP